jgi:hypothetical protein
MVVDSAFSSNAAEQQRREETPSAEDGTTVVRCTDRLQRRKDMTISSIELQGTLHEDGTLVLDEKPNLPPGRVKVTVQAIPDYKQTDIWHFFERIQAERKALGIAPRSQEELDNYLATMRDDDERCQLIEQIQGELRRQRN